MTIKTKIKKLMVYFEEHQPVVQSELHYQNAYELLIATMLAAQCTDKRINLVTPALFTQYPTPAALSTASTDDILKFIHSVSYPNSKAAHISAASKMLVVKFGGEVPQTMEELTQLPGVGRKTANVVLAFAFNRPAMPVDTHVFRVSHRLGIVKNAKTPTEVEKQLVTIIPENLISQAHHWLLLHGRYVCTARKPHCTDCPFKTFCLYYQKEKIL